MKIIEKNNEIDYINRKYMHVDNNMTLIRVVRILGIFSYQSVYTSRINDFFILEPIQGDMNTEDFSLEEVLKDPAINIKHFIGNKQGKYVIDSCIDFLKKYKKK